MKEISLEYLDRKNYRPAIQLEVDTRGNTKLVYNHDVEQMIIINADESVLIEQIRERQIKADAVNDLYGILGYSTYNDVKVWDALESLTLARKEVVVDIITNLYKQQLMEAMNENNK